MAPPPTQLRPTGTSPAGPPTTALEARTAFLVQFGQFARAPLVNIPSRATTSETERIAGFVAALREYRAVCKEMDEKRGSGAAGGDFGGLKDRMSEKWEALVGEFNALESGVERGIAIAVMARE